MPITGLEPFGGESASPSWEVASSLDNATIGGCRVIARQPLCIFGESLAVSNAAIDALSLSLVLAAGQAGGRTGITVERVVINANDVRTADNQGRQLVDVPIVVGGLAAWFSTLLIKAVVVAVYNAGVPASVSQTADIFIYNRMIYGLLHRPRDVPVTKGGLIHIPCLP